MQFDEFDKKIKDAAEHHHPAYDEKAWDKMEMLLDKHLPVKRDDRRRFIFFLLLLFTLGSGAFLLIRNYTQPKTVLIKSANRDDRQTPKLSSEKETKPLQSGENTSAGNKAVSADKTNLPENSSTATIKKGAATILTPDRQNTNLNKPAGTKPLTKDIVSNDKKEPGNKAAAIKNKNDLVTIKQTRQGKNLAGATNKVSPGISPEPKVSITVAQPAASGDIKPQDKIIKTTEPDADKSVAPGPVSATDKLTVSPAVPDTNLQKKQEQQETPVQPVSIAVKKKTKQKAGKQDKSAFAITFTTGPDLSFIGINELGKLKMKYGAGLSYTFRRFTVRSGFYVTKKIYSADGAYYHPYYSTLEKVDGDCKVFEIPVTLSYNFAQAKNHNWFASTGLSSYLMKKETYGYLTKDPATGTSSYYEKTWNNKNHHYFSVLNISAGYERKFTKTISLIAEPYLQVPLTGIGNGKMKLNSAGLLLTLSVKPFGKKK